MGRYSNYIKDIWAIQASRKVIGLTMFGVLFDNNKPFTPGDQLHLADGADEAIKILSQKGYDFLIIQGQPPSKTRNLDMQDFENILAAVGEVVQSLGGRIKNAYYAPGVDKNDPYVKPNTGMFDRAQNEGMIKWSESFYVGADLNDVKAATKSKATPVLIKSKNSPAKTKAFELTNSVNVKEFESLLEFAKSV